MKFRIMDESNTEHKLLINSIFDETHTIGDTMVVVKALGRFTKINYGYILKKDEK